MTSTLVLPRLWCLQTSDCLSGNVCLLCVIFAYPKKDKVAVIVLPNDWRLMLVSFNYLSTEPLFKHHRYEILPALKECQKTRNQSITIACIRVLLQCLTCCSQLTIVALKQVLDTQLSIRLSHLYSPIDPLDHDLLAHLA